MVKISDKQKYFKFHISEMGTMNLPTFKECSHCKKFTKTNISKKLSYWDRYCFNCGEEYG